MIITKSVKFIALAVIAVGSVVAGANQELIVRTSDKLHFDVREIVNVSPFAQQVKVQMELCVALKSDSSKGPDKALCQLIDESKVLAVEGKPADKPNTVVRFKEEAQSRRRGGNEVNSIAKTLIERLAQEVRAPGALSLSQVDFRIALRVFTVNGSQLNQIDTRYVSVPELSQEAPASERGLLISRIEPASRDKLISGRVLVVVTRRGN